MRVSISNIAWDPEEDEAVAELLSRMSVDAIDIAPGKYFALPAEASAIDIARVRGWWGERGFEVAGMQALLFGTTGLNLFGPPEVQESMLGHLAHVCRIGAGLGAANLVFGSPRNRDRSGLDDDAALNVAVPFFRRLGDMAAEQGVSICLEPNPERYGANFMTTARTTAQVVRSVAHPSIGLQLDLGAMALTGEDLEAHLHEHGSLVRHVHASEPDLVPLGDGGVQHDENARVVAALLPDHIVTVEMVATQDEPHVAAIARAVSVAQGSYGSQKWSVS